MIEFVYIENLGIIYCIIIKIRISGQMSGFFIEHEDQPTSIPS